MTTPLPSPVPGVEPPVRILVVDDDEPFRTLVTISLADFGYHADNVPGGEEALAAAACVTYDLMLLDVKMPGMDGIEVLRRVREQSPSVDVIMLTGVHDISLAVEALRLGAREYLTKPFEPENLMQRIRLTLRARAAEERLREIETAFSSRLLFDLHTPLMTVRSAVNFLLNGMAGPLDDQQQEVLSHTGAHVEKIVLLLNDMIDLTKLESGTVALDLHPTGLADVLPAICNELEPRAAAHRVALNVAVQPGLPSPPLDRGKFEQVLVNLLDNAIKHTPAGGTISVSADLAPDGGSIRISVADTGAGITAEELPFIFDKYKEFLIHSSSPRKTTGLGLAICRSIIIAHKGTLGVTSEPGKGSTFTILLPVA